MTSFRFIHCADLHIDSPLRGLESEPDAPVDRIRRASRDAFTALVDYSIEQSVDFVLAAGDLYDGEWQDWRTGQFLIGQIGRLSRSGIPFVAISGNHDAQSAITRRLAFPEPAKLLRTDRPETWYPSNLPGVAVHGQGFTTQAVRDDLSRAYPAPSPGHFNIGMLHSNADGRPGHENYAPCSVLNLSNHGYDYWALGHIHTRAVLGQDPWIVYPGNLQGRHIREEGPRGAMLVTVTDDRIIAPPEFVPFDTVRWARIEVDLSGANDEEAVLSAGRQLLREALERAEGRLLAARVVLRGETPAYAAVVRNVTDIGEKLKAEALAIAGRDAIWLERVSVNVRPPATTTAVPSAVLGGIEDPDLAKLSASAAGYAKDLLDRLGSLQAELGDEHPAVQIVKGGMLPADILERARTLLRAELGEG
ncbi:DNA repair exonuclease [Acidisphaera sp. S103]|uniref:metallophosphoesterase family protein n=1 Tax=Acidisphaera sp. S103 TaxID=1747223 RepID=UPI00131EBC40|nr:DNA repair exonuclease [Acidisphaera sp. S103]